MIEAVIFDLDGTLLHIPIRYEILFKRFSKIMKTENVRPLTETIPMLDERTRKRIFEVWDSEELATLPKIAANREGMALYEKFSGKPKALVTIQGKMLVSKILGRLSLSFDAVLTREDCMDRAKQLKKAAEELGVQLQNVLFVGNGENDLTAAEQAGCQFWKVGK